MQSRSEYRIIPVTDAEHMHRVTARWETVEAEVQARVSSLRNDDALQKASRYLRQARLANKKEARLNWLNEATDALTAVAAKESACSKGCSHCCYIAVTLSEQEAQVISKHAKRSLNRKAGTYLETAAQTLEMRSQDKDRYSGKPCPFLRAGACSIYAHRPFACRSLLNMDKDDLLCQLVDGDEVRVPYLNTSSLQFEYADLLCGDGKVADIREWFPD